MGRDTKQAVLPGRAGSYKLLLTSISIFQENPVSRSFRSVATSSKMASRRWLALSVLVACVSPLGCSSEKPSNEVSASSSGYHPVDAPKGTSPKGNPGTDNATASIGSTAPGVATVADSGGAKPSPTSTSLGSSGGKPAGASTSNATAKPGTNAPDNTNTPPSVPPLPNFSPGQVDPSIAAKSYMKLEMTQSQDPTEILRFIGAIDRSLQELQQDAARRMVNSDLVLDRGMALARMKLTASERLGKVGKNADESSKALIGKLEALGQMAQFKDVPSADELRIVAKELAKNEDPRVARQARRMQLVTALNDFQNQSETTDNIVEIATDLLSKVDTPDASVFMAVAQAAQVLDASLARDLQDGGKPAADDPKLAACDKLVNLLEAKYRDIPNMQMGMGAWQMKIQRLPDFESYLQILDTRQAMSASPEAVTAGAKSLMEKMPSPWTAIVLVQCATQFEFSGNVAVAKSLLEIASTQLETTKTPELRERIEAALKGFQARTGIIGKPLALDSLVDTDGKPMDPEKYKGKVVLVDFWATWCGPCIAEIPNIMKVYEAKQEQGFDVIAVNLDDKRSDLDVFLSQQKTPWTVFVSNDPAKSGMESPLAQSLAITAIPFTILIGKDGNVAAVHIRGTALETKVQELLEAK
ncbi:MAG: redoxin domain-containing protein [Planctomycetes bacterium]|nr:redoxin domain-containing protein [Planctomycetota bacterium]